MSYQRHQLQRILEEQGEDAYWEALYEVQQGERDE